ncbi:phytoene/squalene synthase family protein [Methyloceanibacter superfactus]|uniref:phytoene/squalene synthase family protein n=1 Tax=Methyloceanibacter superfactus TaxID=1774969 RepID=UPI0009F1F027|nr:squalene/phytoene synthase family protein [Methyloceanibacter superfactus]
MPDAGRSKSVRRIARAADPDRTLAALFAPRAARDDLFALFAFNAELARIADLVTEPGLGAIRLQWWRDAIDAAAHGEATGQPVADAFGQALARRGLSRERIGALIDARSFDIGETVMPDARTLDAYLFDTTGGLFALAAEIVGAEGENRDVVAEAAGRAYGLVRVMRSLPVLAAKGRTYLAEDSLLRHGTSPQAIFSGETGPGIEALLAEMREHARESLRVAEFHLYGEGMTGTGINEAGRTAFLPLSLVEPYLAVLAKTADPLHEIVRINPLHRLWRLARSR